jgi:signal transduction histidine kinase
MAFENQFPHVDQVRSDPRRLAAVRDSDLLDTPAEETFDSLCRLAVVLMGAPVSFLSVVDESRDFYKSQYGFPESLAAERQLQGRTFCHYALASQQPLVIEDTHSDSTWRAVPTVDSLGVRAYLGVPVIVNGQPIGSFCVIDTQPHLWSWTEIETLVQVSKAAAREIGLRASLKVVRAATDRANDLMKGNEALLAIVVHDLRSPLQTILLGVAALGRVIAPSNRSLLDRVTRAADSMKHLLDDSLQNYADKNPARVHRTVIVAPKLLGDAMETMEMVAERAGIRLSVHSDSAASIFVDYGQMLRIFGNLVGNCIKYCPTGTAVLLAAQEVEGNVEICVSDNGPGMTAEDQQRAFERNWQGRNSGARQDGAGLGLSIVRELVLQNDGTVRLESQPGRGTSITMRFPIAAI